MLSIPISEFLCANKVNRTSRFASDLSHFSRQRRKERSLCRGKTWSLFEKGCSASKHLMNSFSPLIFHMKHKLGFFFSGVLLFCYHSSDFYWLFSVILPSTQRRCWGQSWKSDRVTQYLITFLFYVFTIIPRQTNASIHVHGPWRWEHKTENLETPQDFDRNSIFHLIRKLNDPISASG